MPEKLIPPGRRDRSVSMDFRPPVKLAGRHVKLEPLSQDDLAELVLAGEDPEIWRYLLTGDARGAEAMGRFIDLLLARQSQGSDLAFTVREAVHGHAIGMTRYLTIRREDRSVEIGGTWYHPRFWRSAVNTEAKYLLLRHAFDTEGCHRVEFKTDVENLRSQRAIERLGAQREGLLREHRVRPDGRFRSSVYYGILISEWPKVRARLEDRLRSDGVPGERVATGAVP
ncbi:MAG: GNAT family N-acetyltransferase [Thermoplasmata archaeon]